MIPKPRNQRVVNAPRPVWLIAVSKKSSIGTFRRTGNLQLKHYPRLGFAKIIAALCSSLSFSKMPAPERAICFLLLRVQSLDMMWRSDEMKVERPRFISRSLGILGRRNGFAYAAQTFGANSVVLVINFATGILTARLLGPSGRGELTALIVWPQLFALSASLGAPQSVIYNLRQYHSGRRFLFGGAVLIATVAGIAAMVLGFFCVGHLLARYDKSTIQFVQASMVLCPMITVSSVALSGLQAAGRFSIANASVLLAPACTVILLFGLAVAERLTPYSAAIAYLLPTMAVLGFCLLFSLRAFGFGIRRRETRLTLSYGIRVWGIDLLGTLSKQMDRAILVNLLAPSLLGGYVVAQSLAQALGVAPTSIATVLFPRAAGRSTEEVVEIAGLAIRVTVAVVALGALTLCLAAPFLFNLFYGHAFQTAITPFRLLACETVFGAATWLASQVFMAVGRPGVVAALQGLGICLFVLLAFLLVPVAGLNGAAAAWLLSSVARSIMMYVCFPAVLKVSVPSPILRSSDFAEVSRRISAF